MTPYLLTLNEGLHPELATLVATLQDGTREWRSNLELPSQEAMVWSPYPNGPSIGGTLLHMAAAELYWLQYRSDGIPVPADHPAWVYDDTLDQYAHHWPKPPEQPIEWYLKIQDEVRELVIDRIRAHNDPDRLYVGETKTLTYRWILAHVVEHDSYTGGQAILLHEMYKHLRAS